MHDPVSTGIRRCPGPVQTNVKGTRGWLAVGTGSAASRLKETFSSRRFRGFSQVPGLRCYEPTLYAA